MEIQNRDILNSWVPWMRRALQLASLGEGFTSPNPLVGAVVLNAQGLLVGDGYHRQAGEAHAETVALNQAGDKAKNGTLIVTLEPCCHHGQTPPCTDAIKKAGIKKVIVGMKDPDPRVSGGGIGLLRSSGIEVITGVLEKEIERQNREFVFRVKTGRSWGILKCAMSLDGRIGLKNGKSKWISGEESRKRVHLLRSKCDAVVVGASTVRQDDPLLTSRGISLSEPIRVVFSRTLEIPIKSKILDTHVARTIVAYGPYVDKTKLDDFPKGVERLPLQSSEPIELAKELSNKGCNKVLWECGSKLATSALEQHCVQELMVFLAPKILGGIFSMTPFEDFGFTEMKEVISIDNFSVEKFGNDLLLTGSCP
ncbi:bifunctional diaminohydroxyphosphoribosylaminopyrimidine deaminase/5-amino-6-(5-phosphoribosylamino)uracil reductase RibD [Prochlorococcus sp. MIT 1223]|uniref:bifunctional diaminohydroxyphosphoribosylaminopyrimidine deaminase/5-amino-6-(5-phosphoribosylamino)uracil reductase RibD n=1 Tax=Prochlorococcus sp. MIT 1223 TaxID=3096217 RepID=UPI002A750762|nr:bifunctional diaminohydroxyphosphoribosylaminopyrimidine deaminase/5-amino-6-(5-phosphoribosylamino)uracil reductase RibD [Prochlorococcus sp. MIT 1223]